MLTNYFGYKVETKNVKFFAEDGRVCPRTAIITFFDSEGEVTGNE